MSLKIAANMSAVVHHIVDGAVTFPYAIDAHSAVSRFPNEWSHEPWSYEAAAKARAEIGEEIEPLSAEEQAALDDHAKAVAEANERLKAFRQKKAAEKSEADQVAADEAMVKSAPPRPDLAARRPFGRMGDPTPAEVELMRKRAEKKAADDKMVREKAEMDRMSASGAKLTT